MSTQNLKQRPVGSATTENTETKGSHSRKSRSSDRTKSFLIIWSLVWVAIVGGLVSGYAITGSPLWGRDREAYNLIARVLGLSEKPVHVPGQLIYLTKEELAKYDGSNPDLPIYLAIKGRIYDVSSNAQSYGKKGGYNGFAGRDASRAFLDLCFSEECLAKADDLTGLTPEQEKGIQSWVEFYEKEDKYPHIGFVKK